MKKVDILNGNEVKDKRMKKIPLKSKFLWGVCVYLYVQTFNQDKRTSFKSFYFRISNVVWIVRSKKIADCTTELELLKNILLQFKASLRQMSYTKQQEMSFMLLSVDPKRHQIVAHLSSMYASAGTYLGKMSM